jgi:putative transposase
MINPQTERLNRTLEQMLRMYISPDMRDWDKWLPPCEFAYNNAYHKSTGYSPFLLAYGRHPVVPASLVEPGCNETVLTAAQFIKERDELHLVRSTSSI